MANKYSLWLIPPEPHFSQLNKVITSLSKQHGTPIFEPHLTLIGGFSEENEESAINRTKKLSQELNPLNLSLGNISFSTTYFQAVFVCIKATAELMQANLKAKEVFSLENDVFMPHISLLYNVPSMEKRAVIANQINLKPATFTVNNLILVPSTPDPTDWHHLAEFPLK